MENISLSSHTQYLVHLVKGCRPHCVALESKDEHNLRVMDGKHTFVIDRRAFWNALACACDQKHVVFFEVNRDEKTSAAIPDLMPTLKERSRLLDLQAGAGEAALPCKRRVRGKSAGSCAWRLSREGVVAGHLQPAESGDELDGVDDGEPDCDEGSEYECEDEAVTNVANALLKQLAQEVDQVRKASGTKKADARGRVACPLCPFRNWPRKHGVRVAEHLARYHTPRQQYTASGTKQLKLIIALHDQDRLQGRPSSVDYLRRSAAIMRSTIDPALPGKSNNIDKGIRLVFTQRGPEFWNLNSTITSPLRRTRNLYYTMEFAQKLYQRSLTCHAKAPCQGL